MKLEDLKTGFLVETREECVYRVIKDYPCKINEDGSYEYEDIILEGTGYDYLNNYNDDLTHCEFEDLDIIKVYHQEPGSPNYTLLWERKEFNGHTECLNLLYNMGYRYITVEEGTLYAYKKSVSVAAPISSTQQSIQIFSRFFHGFGPSFYYEIKQREEKGETFYILAPIHKGELIGV